MTKTDYAALDAAIIDAIKRGKREFSSIAYGGPVGIEAARLAPADSWRMVDRRLQAQRKAGRLSYTRPSKKNPDGGWFIVQPVEA